MKRVFVIALSLAVMVCLTACTKTESNTETVDSGENRPIVVDPATRDWDKISLAAKLLLEYDDDARLEILDALGLELPKPYAQNNVQRAEVIDLILQSASEGHWGAYDYTVLAKFQEDLLDLLEYKAKVTFVGEDVFSQTPSYADQMGLPDVGELTFEKSNQGLLITGPDADVIEWNSPDIAPKAFLYYANPRFLNPYFEDVVTECSAEWIPGPMSRFPYYIVRFNFVKSSVVPAGAITGSSIDCSVDIADRKILEKTVQPWDGEEIPLTDDELIDIACKLGRILAEAQETYNKQKVQGADGYVLQDPRVKTIVVGYDEAYKDKLFPGVTDEEIGAEIERLTEDAMAMSEDELAAFRSSLPMGMFVLNNHE